LKTVLLAAHMKRCRTERAVGSHHWSDAQRAPEVEGGEQILGLFLNTVPFRLKLESGSWRQLIRKTFAARTADRAAPPLSDGGSAGQMVGSVFNTTFSYVHFHVYKDGTGRTGTLFAGEVDVETSLDFLVSFEQSPDTGKLGGTVHCTPAS